MDTCLLKRNGIGRRGTLVLAAVLAAVPLGGRVARAAAEPARPKLVVEQPELDLGIREPGPKIEFVFRLRNAGTAPLEISEAKPSCGCVLAGCDHRILPGGTGTVRATLDTAERHGPVVKHLTVISNDPDNPALVLALKVTLRRPIETSPGNDVQFVLQDGQAADQVVTLHSYEATPLQIVKVESSAPYVKAEVLPGEDEPDDEGKHSLSRKKVRLSVLPGAPTAAFAATVTLHTNSAKRPQIVLNVDGKPAGAVAAYPTRLYFDEVPARPEEPIVRPITLMKQTGSFKLVSAEAGDPALSIQLVQAPAGRFCEVVVRYVGGWKPGLVKGTIVLTTTDTARPRIEIPYTAEVAP